jgi:hypothetical protein
MGTAAHGGKGRTMGDLTIAKNDPGIGYNEQSTKRVKEMGKIQGLL